MSFCAPAALAAAPPEDHACDACLRRTHLVVLLAAHIERARHDSVRLPELLALPGDQLLDALAGRQRPALDAVLERFDPAAARRVCAGAGVTPICRHAPDYPAALLDAADAPAVLHLAGAPERWRSLCTGADALARVAVVGARRATRYGLDQAYRIGRELGGCAITVVSGMALGVDSAAHAGALAAGGATVAVLAGAPDVAYPASKRRLHAELVAGQCVVSEMPPGFRPFKWSFPARNRIIAALGAMTVIVEATERSGSLITADIALQLGRALGAVPGPVDSVRSAGPNALLHDGAHVVRGAQDILDVALCGGWPGRVPESAADAALAGLSPELRVVLDGVQDGRDTPGAIAAQTGDVAAAGVALTQLELVGLLRRRPDGRYVRVG